MTIGNILMMPLQENIPAPRHDDWKPAICPICGADCWESGQARILMRKMPGILKACTSCALKEAGK